jgi:hypothetical protein
MRESRTSGFVRGAHSNMCPYRDPYLPEMTLTKSRLSPGTGVTCFHSTHFRPSRFLPMSFFGTGVQSRRLLGFA